MFKCFRTHQENGSYISKINRMGMKMSESTGVREWKAGDVRNAIDKFRRI